MHQVGLYSAAYKVTNLLEAFPLMVMGTIYPLMSRYASEDLDKLRSLYKKSVFYLGLLAVPMGIGITLLAPIIVRLLFGAQFAEADRALMILVWSTVFLYLALSGGNLLISMGKEKVSLYLNMVGAGLSIALNFLLIPMMGFVGAALATTATYLVILIGVSLASYFSLHAVTSIPAVVKVKDAKI
jgi:O-antigen/teichoic acid export membrane protein